MPTKAPSHRTERVGQEIRRELSSMLARAEIKQPGLDTVVVTAVIVTGDLSIARVCVRTLASEVSPATQRQVVDALTSAGGWLRKVLGDRLRLRRVPSLRFEWDQSVDHGRRIEELLVEIEREPRPQIDGERRPETEPGTPSDPDES